jgi:tripartite-type tricarboxylate transporter receptor subunit TctC
MKRLHLAVFQLTTAVLAASTVPGIAGAQASYPTKPIRIIVPYTAGGGVDTVARLLGEKLREGLGQPTIVDNKPGASGMIGAQAAAKAAPDGYTVLLAAAGEIAVNPHLYQKQMAYDPEKDLAPISLVVKIPNVLVVNPDVPAKTTAELVAHAKANPGKLTYSSSGVGNPQHLNGELFAKMAGIDIVHVPYKGAAQAAYGCDEQASNDDIYEPRRCTALHQERSNQADRGDIRETRRITAQRPGACGVPTARRL